MRKEIVSDLMMIGIDDPSEVTIEGVAVFDRDINYGEDADGNRNSYRVTVEAIDDIQAFDGDGDEVELTTEERAKAENLLTVKFLEG